jgi:anaerobic sulfite reductase subunit B
MKNEYLPFQSEILSVLKHTEKEYTFRMAYDGPLKAGQFFLVSLPKFGESPISVSSMGPGWVEITVRRIGKVTDEIFENYVGDSLFMRGPYGNGFDIENYKGREVVIIAGGTGVSPVRAVIEHFSDHPEDAVSTKVIVGYKTPADVLFRAEMENEWKKKLDLTLTVDANPENLPGYELGMVTKYIPDLQFRDIDSAVGIVVGPPLMMKFTAQGLAQRGLKDENIWLAQERRMCCGLGKCGHCRIGSKYVCLDGPVFCWSEAKDMVD